MAKNSKISWTNHTANLFWGCTKVGVGCKNCYAETLSGRFGINVCGNYNPRKIIVSVWKDLMKLQILAKAANEIHKVFVGSMMDIFEKPMPLINNKGEKFPKEFHTGTLRDVLFDNISKGMYPNLLFLFLTKRPGNINKYIPNPNNNLDYNWWINPPSNVMFGTSPVDQDTADKLIPQLLQVQGKLFLSIEPQVGEIILDNRYLREWCPYCDMPSGGCTHEQHNKSIKDKFTKISWVINGGESGHHRRPFNLEWARSLRDQCKENNVPYFFKQIDKVIEKESGIPEDLQIMEFPNL